MIKTAFKTIIAALLFVGLYSCLKNQKGGKSNINGFVLHHGKAISHATVYVKFNAKEFPGANLSIYNYSVAANKTGYFNAGNFYKGDYYLFVSGIDSTIASPFKVSGGFHINFKSYETVSTDIPVGEE